MVDVETSSNMSNEFFDVYDEEGDLIEDHHDDGSKRISFVVENEV